MKKIINLGVWVCALLLVSCNNSPKNNTENSESSAKSVNITHELGTVEVPLHPKRVVVLDFGELENLDAIGIKPVGIAKVGMPVYLKKFKDDTSIADVGSIVEINLEKINELKPDLIILGGRLRDSYEALSKIAPTIYPAWDTNNMLGALEKNANDIGKIFGREADMQKAFDEIKNKAEFVRTKASKSDMKALILLHNNGRFSAYGSKSRFGIIHDVMGIKEARMGLSTHIHGNVASNELIQQINPDILYVIDRSAAIGDKPLKKEDIENKLVRETKAFKNGKIIYLNSEAWYSSGTGFSSVNIMIDEIDKSL